MISLLSTLRVVSVYLMLLLGAPLMAFDAACARTPQLAVRAARSSANEQLPLQANGYRVQSMRYDPVLDRQWAIIASCGHPERPTFAVAVDSPVATSSGATLHGHLALQDRRAAVVHAGEVVQAWQQEPNLRLEVVVRAEESGGIGSHVRIRVLHSGFESGQPRTVIGIVRGPGNVEIVQ